MEKKNIETFIKKYHLGGTLESVLWNNVNDDLSVTAMTSDRKLFASVQLEKAAFFKDVTLGIADTNKLKRMLVPFSDNIAMSLDIDENDKTRVRQLLIEDGKLEAIYVAAGTDVIDPAPVMKSIPPFTVEIVITPEFINQFNGAFSAAEDKDALFTLVMSKKRQKLDMIIGYKSKNLSDRLAMYITTNAGKDTVTAPISFNAKHLKEIIAANSEVANPILSVSEAGLASISFAADGFKSQYYLVKIDVED